MKKFILLIAAVTAFGCSDDDSNSTGDYVGHIDPALIGEWVATDIIGQEELPECLSSNKYKFRLNGSCIITIDNMNTPCTANTYHGTFIVNNDMLTVDSPGGIPLQYDIVSLTATKLQLKVRFFGMQPPITEYTKQ